MRPDGKRPDVFERAVTIHRDDCSALAEAAGRFEAVLVEPSLDGDPESARRAALVRMGATKVFDEARKLIGQLSGLLILAEISGRRDVIDLPDIPAAKERWRQASDRLGGLDSAMMPPRLGAALARTLDLIGEALAALTAGSRILDLSAPSARISAAYRELRSISDPAAGLSMVDFSQACCSCMQPTSRSI